MNLLISIAATDSDAGFDHLLIWLIVVGLALAASFKTVTQLWPVFVRWSNEKRSRDWPSLPGVIDIVAVAKEVESAGKGAVVIKYKALLTYSYHNPDLQTGDYNRSFGVEDDARDWVDSLKGCKVPVYVDPRDPTRSVLRSEDVDAACLEKE